MVGIGAFRFPGLMRTRLNIEPYSSLKPTKDGFIFNRPNSLIEPKILQLSITWRKLSLELGRRAGLKVEFQELRLEPNFLNRGLRYALDNNVYNFKTDNFQKWLAHAHFYHRKTHRNWSLFNIEKRQYLQCIIDQIKVSRVPLFFEHCHLCTWIPNKQFVYRKKWQIWF